MIKQRRKTRFIGNTNDMEIDADKHRPRYHIYADTETYLRVPSDIKLWEMDVTTKEYKDALKQCRNVPGLLVGSYKPITIQKHKTDKYESNGGYFKHELLVTGFQQFFEHLKAIYAYGKRPVIWFHNASYDLTAIAEIGKKFLDPELVIYFYAKDNNKSFLRGAMYSPRYNFRACLADTMLFETISIASAGKSIGKEKLGDVPYTMSNVQIVYPTIYYTDYRDGKEKTFNLLKYIEYAKRDVEIQTEYAENLSKKKELIYKTVINDEETYHENKKKLRGLTQGSLAKELTNVYLTRHSFPKGIDGHFRFELDPQTQQDVYEQTVNSNMGGYTTSNKVIRYYRSGKRSRIYVCDCNSEYPYILTGYIPYGDILNNQPDTNNYITGYVVSFKKCEWKGVMECLKYPPISSARLNQKKDFKFYMTKEYYEMIDRLCNHESTIHAVKYQKSTLVFKDYINRLYNLRNDFKKQLNELSESDPNYSILKNQEQGCKIIMNSIYGKLCEKSHTRTCFYYDNHKEGSRGFRYAEFTNTEITLRCILSGAYITYAGRLLLIDKIEKCIRAGFTVLYSDTDSVMFTANDDEYEKIKEIFGDDTGQLGQGKCEGKFTLFLNSGVKKKYCLLDDENPSNYKIAGSGINKEVPETFKRELNKGNRQTIEDLKVIFDPNENILFKNQKRCRVLSTENHQKIIYDTDFQMNDSLGKVTGECILTDDGYILKKYG